MGHDHDHLRVNYGHANDAYKSFDLIFKRGFVRIIEVYIWIVIFGSMCSIGGEL